MSDTPDLDAPQAETHDRVPSGRRRFLTGGAAAAVAGVAMVSGAEPAAAANGDNLKIGQGNSGTNTTTLTGSTIKVQPSGSSLSEDAGVWGISKANGDVGVRGDWEGTSGSGTGVRGTTNKGVGVVGEASDAGGIGLVGSSPSGAALQLDNTTVAMPPTGGSTNWQAGSFAVKSGQLWYCYQGGTGANSKWVRLSQAFVALDAPERVYDSRVGKSPSTTVAKSKLQGGNSRVIDVTETGKVPSGISSVSGNLTIVNTDLGSGSAGFLSIYPNGVSFPGTSTINWTSNNAIIASSFTVSVDGNGKLRVFNGSATTRTDFIIDITGYHL